MSSIEKCILLMRSFISRMYCIANPHTFGRNVKLFGLPHIVFKRRVRIGDKVRINPRVFIHGAGGVVIEKNVTLSYGVAIFSTGYDTANWQKSKFEKPHKSTKVVICENVWLGANSTVLQGVTIEEGIVVGAGSVVNSSLSEPNSLYAGSPAKFIKKLE
ncbi:acyltransferase [Halomonas cupida]|uniref:acyltransferase n=1 Tax=Halomonas cupida TaxID=44933 RepID=UPI003EF9A355